MKIAVVNIVYWPIITGGVTISRNLAHAIANRGNDVRVFTLSQNNKSYDSLLIPLKQFDLYK